MSTWLMASWNTKSNSTATRHRRWATLQMGQLYPFLSQIFNRNLFQTMVDNTTNTINRPTDVHTLNPVGKKFIGQYVYYRQQLKSSFLYEVTRLKIMKAT